MGLYYESTALWIDLQRNMGCWGSCWVLRQRRQIDSATQSRHEDGYFAFYMHDRAVPDSSKKRETGFRK